MTDGLLSFGEKLKRSRSMPTSPMTTRTPIFCISGGLMSPIPSSARFLSPVKNSIIGDATCLTAPVSVCIDTRK